MMRASTACRWLSARARPIDRLRRHPRIASALVAAAVRANNVAWSSGPEPPAATWRIAVKHALTIRPGWSQSRANATTRKPAATSQDAGTLTIAVSHAAIASHGAAPDRSEEHTSELQSQSNLVCRLLL